MQQVLHLHHLHDRGKESGQGEDLDERDEGGRDEHPEVEREGRGGDLARQQRGMGVEGDRREKQRERDDEDDREEDEGVRRLIVRQARGERERADAKGPAQRDEREMPGRRVDAPVPVHLEGE